MTDATPLGSPVTNLEVTPYGNHKCRICHGAGWYDVTRDPKIKPDGVLCGCAVKRFVAINGERICRTKNGLSWKEPHERLGDDYRAG